MARCGGPVGGCRPRWHASRGHVGRRAWSSTLVETGGDRHGFDFSQRPPATAYLTRARLGKGEPYSQHRGAGPARSGRMWPPTCLHSEQTPSALSSASRSTQRRGCCGGVHWCKVGCPKAAAKPALVPCLEARCREITGPFQPAAWPLVTGNLQSPARASFRISIPTCSKTPIAQQNRDLPLPLHPVAAASCLLRMLGEAELKCQSIE